MIMKKYIAAKIVEAEPMSAMLAERTLNRKVDVSNAAQSESGETGHPGYLVQYEDGYKSWCPKKQFEEANRPCDSMSFGLAIEAVKRGHRVARKGWNGKGMYLSICENGLDTNLQNRIKTFIMMRTVQDEFVPWLASQTDMLADDWVVIS